MELKERSSLFPPKDGIIVPFPLSVLEKDETKVYWRESIKCMKLRDDRAGVIIKNT